MFCPYCGNENKNVTAFCGKCGRQINSFPIVTPPTLKAERPVVAKNRSPIIAKSTVIKAGLAVLLTVFYIGISWLLILLLNMKDTIMIKTAFDSDVCEYLTLKEWLDILITGNRIFNPTAVSTAIGVGTYMLIYSVPVFAGIALIGTLISKKAFSLHIVSSIISILSAAAVAIITPISVKVIPELKQAVSVSAGVIYEDIASFSFTMLIILAAVVLVLSVASGVVTAMFNKRRS